LTQEQDQDSVLIREIDVAMISTGIRLHVEKTWVWYTLGEWFLHRLNNAAGKTDVPRFSRCGVIRVHA
jgi:hypothetical protein